MENFKQKIVAHNQVKKPALLDEKLYKNIVEIVPYGIEECDSSGTITFTNRALNNMLGCDSDWLLGKAIWDFNPSEEGKESLKEYFKIIVTEQPDSTPYEGKCLTKDGRIIDILLDWGYKRDDQGNLTGIISTIADITKQKRIEEELNQKTKLLLMLHEITSTANESRTEEDSIKICLDLICSHTGWPVGHVYIPDHKGTLHPTKTWYFKDPHRFETFRKITERTIFKPGEGLPGRVLESGRPAWITDVNRENYFLRSKLGENIALKTGFAFPVLEGKKVVAVLEFFSEKMKKPDKLLLETISNFATQLGRVTERKRTEQIIGFQSQIIDQIHDSVISTSLDGYITSWNKGSERSFGYKATEIIGKHVSTLYPGEDHEIIRDQIISPLREKGAYELEVRAKKKSGEYIFIHLSLSLLRDKMGNEIGMIGYSMDITQRRNAEETLVKYHNHLEDLVKERTRDLETAQIELMRKERLAVLGQLTAMVSHELRNPLGTIRTSVFSIREESRNRGFGLETTLDRVERSILRCKNIIDDLLEFSQIRGLNLESTDVDIWLREIISEQDILNGSRLKEDFSTSIKISLDRERFRRAVINVIQNACQAMEENKDGAKKELKISTRVAKNQLEIFFKDTGPGIPPEAMMKVFEPLYSTKSFGIGLGLPIVKRIMEQHNGGIKINSKNKMGTTVTLWIPILENDREKSNG